MHFAHEIVVGWRNGPSMEAEIEPQKGIVERVTLALDRDEVHVLEPRQIVLGRSWRAAEPLRNFREIERLDFGEDTEDGFERAIAARAMQTELVAFSAERGEPAVRRELRGERGDGIGRGPELRHRAEQDLRVRGTSA